MNRMISVMVGVVATVALAQETVDMAMMQKIKDEGRNHSQVTLIAHNLTDVCGPRLTNSPGYDAEAVVSPDGKKIHFAQRPCICHRL